MKLSYIVEFKRGRNHQEWQMYENIRDGFLAGKSADEVAQELQISDLFVKQCYKVLSRSYGPPSLAVQELVA